MKSILNLIAVCTIAAVVAGCSSSRNSVSPGAVGENGKCCGDKTSCTTKEGASMGAMGEKSGCCKTSCTDKAKTNANMGAVSDKAECQKVCPVTGQTVSPGAVSETKKSGCCASKKTSG